MTSRIQGKRALKTRRTSVGLVAILAIFVIAQLHSGTATAAPSDHVPGPPGGTDGRKYELVTPAQKYGFDAIVSNGGDVDIAISPGGDRASFESLFPLEGTSSGNTSMLADRIEQGWTHESVFPAPGANQGFGAGSPDAVHRGATPDLRTHLFFSGSTPPFGALFIRRGDGTVQRIADATAAPPGSAADAYGNWPFSPNVQSISEDGRHVVFNSAARLGPAADLPSGSNRILYEWIDDGANGGEGTLRVVNRTDDATLALVAPQSAALGGGTVGASGVNPGAIEPGQDGLSEDGSRIYFQSPAPTQAPNPGGDLYLREDGEQTTIVSAPEPGYVPETPATAIRFLASAADGSRAYFYADGDLTPGAPPEGGIYRFDLGSPQPLTFLVPTETFVYTALASDDGTKLIYSDGARVNLIRNGEPTVVLEGRELRSCITTTTSKPGNMEEGPTFCASRVVADVGSASADFTPDGRYVVFSASSGGGQGAVYRLDTSTATLDSVSLDADTVRAGLNRAGGTFPQRVRVVSDDGNFVFFVTADRLTIEDRDDTIDVYRWRATDGDVSLISPGRGGWAQLAGTDATGKNVLFYTSEALVPQDFDQSIDVYSARIGGGIPYSQSAEPCVGEACQQANLAPEFVVPPSSTLHGAGNPSRSSERDGSPDRAKCRRLKQKAKKRERRATKLADRARIKRGRNAKKLKRRAKAERKSVRSLEKRARRCSQRAV